MIKQNDIIGVGVNREDVQKHGANRFPGEYKISG